MFQVMILSIYEFIAHQDTIRLLRARFVVFIKIPKSTFEKAFTVLRKSMLETVHG